MLTFYSENITAAISTFRPDGEVPVLNEQHWDGGQCRIFKVDFANGESWSVRIPIHVQSDSQDTIIGVLQGEQDVLQELGKTDFPWAPKHYGSSLTFENLVRFPFMALSWIEGSPLLWTPTDPPRPVRNKVLAQVAEIQMTLIECTKEDRGAAAQYFSRLIDNKLRRAGDGKLDGITVQDCFDQKVLLDQVLYPELEHAPFAIDHGDLAPLNIIVNSEYDVTGIIDWGFASKVPVQLAGRLPRFLQLSELILPQSSTLQEDRKAYIASLKSHSSQVASWMSLIHSSPDVDIRHCVLESMISKGMHLRLARLGWKLPYGEPQDWAV
ncbi:hypothetical protein EJ02DRAFT_360414 [Clathrospora elynae]|uniref:Aminoglycoside phosphotransferase domain-containing protein n=1 Tax=Clathrospora elynae TaxID=706981 RepID=A0A6A5S795_9PLEO|nr:hypothetical protein EJ02DRAFT_360414 [Clathrospora elynae]